MAQVACVRCGKGGAAKKCGSCGRVTYCGLSCQLGDYASAGGHGNGPACKLEKLAGAFLAALNGNSHQQEAVVAAMDKLRAKVVKVGLPGYPAAADTCHGAVAALTAHAHDSLVVVSALALVAALATGQPSAQTALCAGGAPAAVLAALRSYPDDPNVASASLAAMAALLNTAVVDGGGDNRLPPTYANHNLQNQPPQLFTPSSAACEAVLTAMRTHRLFDRTALAAVDGLCLDDPANRATFRALGAVELLRKTMCPYSGGKAVALLTYDIATREHAQETVNRLRGF